VTVPWIEDYAARAGLRYEPEVDERWLRVWEPYATLKTPIRYEHALHLSAQTGALTFARFVLPAIHAQVPGAPEPKGPEAWICVAQDERLTGGRACSVSDSSGIFAEPLDLVPMPRRTTGDAAFDHAFASFSETPEDMARITPSLRKLVLGWRVPLHFELRKGGFILAPVALRADPPSLQWLAQSAQLFADKAAKL
jgi:hypothetical protein